VTPAKFRKFLLALEGVEERPHTERAAFRTKRKIFATLGADRRVNLKIDPVDGHKKSKPLLRLLSPGPTLARPAPDRGLARSSLIAHALDVGQGPDLHINSYANHTRPSRRAMLGTPRLSLVADIGALEFVREQRLKNNPPVFMPLPGMIVYSGDGMMEFHWMCRVRVEGRVVLELNERFAESSALVETLRARTIEKQVPQIRGDGRVVFGLVAVTEEHLEVRGKPIPWRDIAALSIQGPLLRVFDRSDTEVAKATVEKNPNVHLVMALHERLVEG